jgi:chromosome segregation ATPase
MKPHILGLAVVLAAATGGAAATARTQGTQTPDVLAALLAEVRGLRTAMEQMAAAGPRVELALGRLQLQEQRINNLARRLESTRANLGAAQREVAQNEEQIRNFEAALRGVADPQERQDMEQQLDVLRRVVAAAQPDIQRLIMEESQVAAELAAEQGRWAEINQRVEALERALERR